MEEKIKIAVKLPESLKEVMLAFPFLHSLNEKLKPGYLHLIGPEECLPLLSLLPFNPFFHSYADEDYKNFLDVHRYCVDQKDLSHADTFFALEDEPKMQFMSMCFRAKSRVGFDNSWGKLFLNIKEIPGDGLHQSERYLKLLSSLTDIDYQNTSKVGSKKFKPRIADWEESPYIVVDLPYDRINNEIPPDWIEFVDFLEKRKVLLTCSEAAPENRKEILDRFIEELKMPVDIHAYLFNDFTEFANIVAFSKGVIVKNNVLSHVAAYVNAPTIILFEKGVPKHEAPLYFKGKINIHSIDDTSLLKTPGVVSEDKLTKFDLGKLFDKSLSFFELG